MAAGWVYVLVNSAMPGLTKVGKTTRPPAHRANELSGVTGVPTPFIVAFEQYFEDCDVAEAYVHTELGRLGIRESNNREFFRASTNDVVRLILRAPGVAAMPDRIPVVSDNINNAAQNQDNEFSFDTPPWADVLEQANDAYYGSGDAIQDYQEALKLYTDAARLGSLEAYEQLGDIHWYGQSVREDSQRAIEFYKEGARKGNYYCYANMAQVYEREKQLENAKKAWAQFFKLRGQGPSGETESDFKYTSSCASYVEFFCRNSVARDFADKLISEENIVRRRIIDRLWTRVTQADRRGASPNPYRDALNCAQRNLSDGGGDSNEKQPLRAGIDDEKYVTPRRPGGKDRYGDDSKGEPSRLNPITDVPVVRTDMGRMVGQAGCTWFIFCLLLVGLTMTSCYNHRNDNPDLKEMQGDPNPPGD